MGVPDFPTKPPRPESNGTMASNDSTLYPSAPPSIIEKSEKSEPMEAAHRTSMPPAPSPLSEEVMKEEPGATEVLAEQVPGEGIEAADKPEGEEEEETYPTGLKLLLITIALCLSVFCMALDNTIIATAIPRITDQFKALNDVGWYGSAYLLTTCAFQLLFGKFYSFFSIKWIYLIALAIFEIGSLVCGIAPNSNALIVGRAIAGVGSAGIFSGAILIVAHTVPLRQRPTYTGLIGAMYGIASVAGPLMGGAFTDHLTWRWCFYINLPFGAVTAIFIVFFFTAPKSNAKAVSIGWKARLEQFDIYGTIVFIPAIVCLLLALQWGGSKYAWKSGNIIGLFVAFGVLTVAFVGIQIWKQENATVPPRVLKQRSVAGGAWFGATLGAAFFVMVYFLPIWFQAIKGVSATKSGIMNLPLILGLVVVSMVAGIAITYVGYYTPFVIGSSVLMAIGAGLLSTFKTDTGHAMWIGYQFIFGAGVGLGMQQTLIAVQTVLPAADIPIGTAIMMFSQTLGGALFISIAQNVFTNQLLKSLKEAVPDLNPAIVLATGATSLKTSIEAKFLPGVLQAYNTAIMDTFYVSVALGALSLFGALAMEWKSVKGKKTEMAMA
ncbi:hypothetical protein B0A49_06837 [Cryomyces minteri]|uniref:Major facilitator superfamily (MFS) profile domain-containing protein n=1 Tax=Cryomyces minteri TaxID=331657 RepID=A0A4U0XD54_9PEZI|nr:hypothetical protein B0A49_06837 [Cryomyces minteri]